MTLSEDNTRRSDEPSGSERDALDAIHFHDGTVAAMPTPEAAEDGEWIRADITDCIDQQVWA